MSKRRSHLIERQVFELTATASRGAFEWERNAAGMQERIIAPAVEECFRDFPMRDGHLVIERLEIDLGTFSLDRFEKEAGRGLAAALRERLQTLYGDSRRRSVEMSTVEAVGSPSPSPESQKSEVPLLAGYSKADFLAFTMFLRRGRLPWWYDSHDIALAPPDLFTADWIGSLGHSDRAELKGLLRSSADARIRLATQFTAERIAGILRHIGLFGEEGLQTWGILHRLFQSFPRFRPAAQQSFWTAWMATASDPSACPDVSRVLEEVARGDRTLLDELCVRLSEICLETSAGIAGTSPARRILEQLQSEQDRGSMGGADASPYRDEKEASNPAISKVPRDRPDPDPPGRTTPPAPMQSVVSTRARPSAAKEEEAVFVHTAGLVLLHPFLPELFTQTNLWDGRAWRTEQAVFRAVHLLSYLASGEEGVAEYRLLFHKIISGIEMETALPADEPLEPQEIDACEELLTAVIGHWKALGRTSSDGLREAFIRRQGKLTSIDNGYQLQVERKAQDVLISRLPWGFALVKLPWMKSMLHVTWT